MISLSETNLTLTIPPLSTIPILSSLPIPNAPTSTTTLTFPLENLKTTLRIVVIISTYLLFRPHLEKIFRTITGRPNAEELDLKERMEFIKSQQAQTQSTMSFAAGGKSGDGRRGGASSTTGSAATSASASGSTAQGANKAGAKRVVAVATPGGSTTVDSPTSSSVEKGKSGVRRKA